MHEKRQKEGITADHQLAKNGGRHMPVLGGSTQEFQSVKPAIGNIPEELVALATRGAPRGSKLKISIEKKIENIWLESKELGWSYNDFIAHLLEVLVVLNHRAFLPKANSNGNGLEKPTAPNGRQPA
jgi:hypothetical protein